MAEATPEPAQSGTAHEQSGQADGAPQRRLIRVFVSSTFVDFMEERELLAKRVFPALQRRAVVRGVELVDVDLRWGVTEAMTRNGRTLPICLAAIDRCRPYFIGLLGERYGWVPPPDPRYYQSELLEREPWLKERMGGASVTELEILHGVLRNPAMGGRAFFYLRDPAYARARGDAGWLAESEAEQQRLDALKQQVRQSGFPVVEGLADPEAIAERIEADLWALIEEQFPEEQQPDALERENRQHAAYRRARTGEGRYIDDGGLVRQLEERLVGGDQALLIEGESGAGKSALIANWLEVHARSHPEDVVHAHHLGCSNDASALRPLLARLIENAKPQLLAEQLISEAPLIPQDWWELVARVAETLYSLGRSAMKRGGRWILVLDGLDRLREEDQQALPWLPLQLPEGVAVVVSALACSARTILEERGYSRLMVGPLAEQAQEQLIRRYLNRYEKELEDGLRQQILEHPQAGSPLFLRVLLEELRQCGRHDTLAAQLDGYLSAGSIDALYGKVLERLEQEASEDVQSSGDSDLTAAEASEQRDDQAANPVRRVMSALWASRAGLSENELQAITGLTPRQWAPIELAMASAFGRNGNRLVFDHDFLRIAVQERYLPSEEARRQAHSDIADWFADRDGWDERDSEELPWQIWKAGDLDDLRDWLIDPWYLSQITNDRGEKEIIGYWHAIRRSEEEQIDDFLEAGIRKIINSDMEDSEEALNCAATLSSLLEYFGQWRAPLCDLREFIAAHSKSDQSADSHHGKLSAMVSLAKAKRNSGSPQESLMLYTKALSQCNKTAKYAPFRISCLEGMAGAYMATADYKKSLHFYKKALKLAQSTLGPCHPYTIVLIDEIGVLYNKMNLEEVAAEYFDRAYEFGLFVFGSAHVFTLRAAAMVGDSLRRQGQVNRAIQILESSLQGIESLHGKYCH